MILLTFDYQGVFHDQTGNDVRALFDFIKNPPFDTRIAIVSLLSRQTIVSELQERNVSIENIQVFGYEDMQSKSEAILELQDTWQPNKTVFVTDTVRDCEDVARTDTTILAVTWGFGRVKNLQHAPNHAIIDEPEALLTHIISIL